MPRQNRGIERLKTEVNRSSPDAYDKMTQAMIAPIEMRWSGFSA